MLRGIILLQSPVAAPGRCLTRQKMNLKSIISCVCLSFIVILQDKPVAATGRFVGGEFKLTTGREKIESVRIELDERE